MSPTIFSLLHICDTLSEQLTQFAVAEALLLHLALEGPHLLQPGLLVLDVLSEAQQLLLLGGLLLLPLLLLLQVAQPLLLGTHRGHSHRHTHTHSSRPVCGVSL